MLSALEKFLMLAKGGVGALRTMTPEAIAMAIGKKGLEGGRAAFKTIKEAPEATALGALAGGVGSQMLGDDEPDEEEIKRLLEERDFYA